MDTTKTIGKNMKLLRKEMGYTQEQLAIESKLSTTHLRAIEHGTGNPTIKTLDKIANCLNTQTIALLWNPEVK